MKLTGRLYNKEGDAFRGGYVRVEENDTTGTNAEIYEDEDLESVAPNPLTVTDPGGYYDLYVKSGEYTITVGQQKQNANTQSESDLLLGGISIESDQHEHYIQGGIGGAGGSTVVSADDTWTTNPGAFMSGFNTPSKHWTYSTPDPRITYDADPFFQDADDEALMIFRATGYTYDQSGGTECDYIDIGFSLDGATPTRWTTNAVRNKGNQEKVAFYHVDVFPVGLGSVVRLQRRQHGGDRSGVSNIWGSI